MDWKNNLQRIMSMMTKLIQPTETVAEQSIEYEKKHEPSMEPKCSIDAL
jgi:hypothetical protein